MIEPSIFKANDVRGVVGGDRVEWDQDGARAIGAAYVSVLNLQGGRFVLGRDMRSSGVAMADAFIDGATGQGADVIDIGLASTDQLWFASGLLDLPGVQLTASHNPADYNGLKFCLAQAAPIEKQLLAEIKRVAMGTALTPAPTPGRRRHRDVLPEYAAHLHTLVPLDGIRRLKVVYDAGNGMAGHTAPAVLGPLNLDLVGLFTELDGSFPNHPPNPLEPQNLVDAQSAVCAHRADVGLVFDGDADRCFIIDERGEVVSPSAITALIARQELAREPGGTIVINTITSRAVNAVVAADGGRLVISKVGHTAVKALMAQHRAIFGGEHSAHYYFRDFWGADTGMLAALHVLAQLGRSSGTMSELVAGLPSFSASGELNSTVTDVPAVIERVATAFAGRGAQDRGDGLTIETDDWWVNVRPSNTEPLLRLNVEARSAQQMASLRDEALAIIRGGTDA